MEYRKYQEDSIRDPEFLTFMLTIAYKAHMDEFARRGLPAGAISKDELNEVLAKRFGFIGNYWQGLPGKETVESMHIVDADRFHATVGRWWDEIREASEGKK